MPAAMMSIGISPGCLLGRSSSDEDDDEEDDEDEDEDEDP